MDINKELLIKIESILVAVLFIFLALSRVPLMLNLAFILFLVSLIYALHNIKNRSALFAFMICYFIFLIGGDLTYYLFPDVGYMTFDRHINNYAYRVIFISNLAILLSFIAFEKYYPSIKEKVRKNSIAKQISQTRLNISNTIDKNHFSKYAIYFLYLVLTLSFISKIIEISYVLKNGYYEYFVNYQLYTRQNILIFFLQRVDMMLPVVMSIVLALNFKIKVTYRVFVFYFIYLALTLLTGQRGPFMLGVFYIFIYLLNRKEFVNKNFNKLIKYAIIAVPALLILLFIIGNVRFGNSSSDGFFMSIIKMINSQGVTINTIKNEYIYRHLFEDKLYTLNFLYGGFFPIIFRFKRYVGNSIETATLGHDFNHALGYAVLGESYLRGQGTGSSYIAETMTDGGILYLILFSIIYAFIIYLISNLNERTYIKRFILLLITTEILWGIRANATGFIATMVNPSTILAVFGFIFLYLFILMLENKKGIYIIKAAKRRNKVNDQIKDELTTS